MDWKRELEALVREAADLVERTATNRQGPVEQSKVMIAPAKPALAEAPSSTAAPLSCDTSEREHIAKRVQNFRAHQERVRREREDFYSRTMQRARTLAGGRSENSTSEPR